MSNFKQLQRKNHFPSTSATPASGFLRSFRPFAPISTSPSQHVPPVTQARLDHAAPVGYSITTLPLFPPMAPSSEQSASVQRSLASERGNTGAIPLSGVFPLPQQTSAKDSLLEAISQEPESRQERFESIQNKENKTGLPDRLKAGIETLSGISMDDVHVHYNSPKPPLVQALAYTQGTDIYVRPEQERHLLHEAWHVVQQKQGRVKPTLQAKGVTINDDEGLEQEADMMGAKVARGMSMKAYMQSEDGGIGQVEMGFQGKAVQRHEVGKPAGTGVAQNGTIQMQRKRRKDYKKERERLASQKRMGPVIESMEQAEDEQNEEAYESEFDQYLREAMNLILGEEAGGIGGGARFGSFWQAYDKTYWRAVRKRDEDKLVLNSGVKPAAAIDFLFADLNKWAFDCADAIQVARWYAMRHAMGANKFNSTVHNMEFALKSDSSTGLQSLGMYVRTDEEGYYDINESLKFSRDGSSKSREVTAKAESIVRRAPVGTRVMLTCDDENVAGTDYENENVVKIGPDQYAAHPLGIGTLDYIINEVAKTALNLDEKDIIGPQEKKKIEDMRKKIYISEIELIRKR